MKTVQLLFMPSKLLFRTTIVSLILCWICIHSNAQQVNPNLKAGLKAYYNSNNEQALQYFKAAGDDPEALCLLARMYYRGDGVKADYVTAKTYAENALNKGNGMGNIILHFIYESGDANIKKDKTLSDQYLERALPAINQLRRQIIQQIERVYEIEVTDSNSLRMQELEPSFYYGFDKNILDVRRLTWAQGIAYGAIDDNVLLNAAYIHMYAYLMDNKRIAADKVFTGISLYFLGHYIGYVQSTVAVANYFYERKGYRSASDYYDKAYKRNNIRSFLSVVNCMKQLNEAKYKILDTLKSEMSKKNEILPECIGLFVEQAIDDKAFFSGKQIYEWAMVGYKLKSTICAYYLGYMYEKGYYVFQDMDKAIRYYEEAGKLSTTSYGPFEAARLKITMKKADSTASWQLIRNAAAAGNERARVYNIDLARSVVNFNSNGLMGTIKPVVDFYPYSPILFKRDHEFPMRFQVNYQNNSGSNIQVFPTKVWNIPHDLYAPSSPKGAGAQEHETYIIPEEIGTLFGNLPIAFRTRNTNNTFRTVLTVNVPVAVAFLSQNYEKNITLNVLRESSANKVQVDDLLNLPALDDAGNYFASKAETPRTNLQITKQLNQYEIANWMKIQLPAYLGINEYKSQLINLNNKQFAHSSQQYGVAVSKISSSNIYNYTNNFEKMLDNDDSLKLTIRKFLFSDNTIKTDQPYIQIRQTNSGKTSRGDQYRHVAAMIRFGKADLINEFKYCNIVLLQSEASYYMILLQRSSYPKPLNENSASLSTAEENALYEQMKVIIQNIECYE